MITTDFSESQLELITGVHASVESCEAELAQIHQFVYRAIGDEQLWVGSMPCGLPGDEFREALARAARILDKVSVTLVSSSRARIWLASTLTPSSIRISSTFPVTFEETVASRRAWLPDWRVPSGCCMGG